MSNEIPLSTAYRQVLYEATNIARSYYHTEVNSEHLLIALLDIGDPTLVELFASLRIAGRRIRKACSFVVTRDKKRDGEPAISVELRAIRELARREARELHASTVQPIHVFLGILRDENCIAAKILRELRITMERVRPEIIRMIVTDASRAADTFDYLQRMQATPTLNLVSRDLTVAAYTGQLEPLIGRQEELERAMQILIRRVKNNPVLLGEAGVGKSAIAEGLAYRIVMGQVPDQLKRQRVVALDVGLLTIGTKFRGDFEERLKRIVAEITATRNIIIVVDELHALIGAGVAEGSVDAANLLKPILARGEFRCLGTTTYDEYRKTIERDPALERRFQPIHVRETTPQETLDILVGIRERYEAFHHVRITDEALQTSIKLADRYIHHRNFPDKAIDLIDEAAARARVNAVTVPAEIRSLQVEIDRIRNAKDQAIDLESFALATALWKQERQLRNAISQAESDRLYQTSAEKETHISGKDIAFVVSRWSGIPVGAITEEESQQLLSLEHTLHERIVGQDKAISAVASAIRRSRSEIRDPRRPIGSFIFAGPTGVGKSALAKTLALALFGQEEAIISIDMSEFMDAHYVARLVGSPPGYIGYDQAGQLTEAVRRRPYSLILLDEIEKAHPRVFDLLLQILEDGHLTDGKGRFVDFRNTIIIMTTNIGSQESLRKGNMSLITDMRPDTGSALYEERVKSALQQHFKPEFLNRIDETILFHPLAQSQVYQIAEIMLKDVRSRLLLQRAITIEVTARAQEILMKHGYSLEYGARPLRRALQRYIEDPLAEKILTGEIHTGDYLSIDYNGSSLIYSWRASDVAASGEIRELTPVAASH